MNRSALLLLALAAAACAAPAAARGLRGLEAGLAPAPNATTTTVMPAQPKSLEDMDVYSRVLAYVETAGDTLTDALAGFFGGSVCTYGQNCGMNCVSDTYDEADPLDSACYTHDRCMEAAAGSSEEQCACDDALISAANEIASLDEQSDMVLTAPTISDGIRILGKALHGCYW